MIPIKNITKQEFKHLITYNKITFGSEGIICEGDNPYSLYKLFAHFGKPKFMGEGKEQKIRKLYELNIENATKPLSIICLNDTFVGYEMTTDYNLKTYNLQQLSLEELKHYLTETKRILEYFKTLGIIYGDSEPRNILFDRNTGEIQFCDMDNIKLNGIPMDLVPASLQEYEAARGIDEGVHPFMHNHLILKAFGLDIYYSSNFELCRYFRRSALKTIESMKNPEDFDNEYILEKLRKINHKF